MGFDEGVLNRSSMPWLLPFTRLQLIRCMAKETFWEWGPVSLPWEWPSLWPMAARVCRDI